MPVNPIDSYLTRNTLENYSEELHAHLGVKEFYENYSILSKDQKPHRIIKNRQTKVGLKMVAIPFTLRTLQVSKMQKLLRTIAFKNSTDCLQQNPKRGDTITFSGSDFYVMSCIAPPPNEGQHTDGGHDPVILVTFRTSPSGLQQNYPWKT